MSKAPKGKGRTTDSPEYLYVVKGLSLREIAQRLEGKKGCSRATLERLSAKEKWQSKREDYLEQVAARAAESAVAADAVAGVGLPAEEGATEGVSEGAAGDEGREGEGGAGRSAQADPRPPTVVAPDVTVVVAPGALHRVNGAWRQAVSDSIQASIEIDAQQIAKDVIEARQAFRGVRAGAQMLILRANQIISSVELEQEPTGDEEEDGDPAMRLKGWRKTTGNDLLLAARLLAQAHQLLVSSQENEPTAFTQRLLLQTDQLALQVKYLEMRTDGTLPAEKVKYEFEQQMSGLLARMEKTLPPSEYEKVLIEMERTLGSSGKTASN